jgi:hypothetical protein
MHGPTQACARNARQALDLVLGLLNAVVVIALLYAVQAPINFVFW